MPLIDKQKKELSFSINSRFLHAMDYCIRKGYAKNVKDFCDKIGCMVGQMHFMEKGERYPTLEMVASICQVFNISETYLIRGQRPIEFNVFERLEKLETALMHMAPEGDKTIHKNDTQEPKNKKNEKTKSPDKQGIKKRKK